MKNDALLQKIKEKAGAEVLGSAEFRGDLTVTLSPGALFDTVRFLRDDPELSFDYLVDLVSIDALRLGRPHRFEAVYLFKSLRHGHRVQVKCCLPGEAPALPTLSGLFAVANWLEREAWDMMGIQFTGHPNLKRILNHASFEGHPLRKDYPIRQRQALAVNDNLLDEMAKRLAEKGVAMPPVPEACR